MPSTAEPLLAYREAALNLLERDAERNLARYTADAAWADAVPGVEPASFPTRLTLPRSLTLELPDGRDTKDAVNARRIHAALPDLAPADAADPRLWAYLTHVTFWHYMRKRWDVANPANKGKTARQINYVREHYFLSGNRATVRNGIARLWWFGHLTHDPARDDPYELTDVLLSQLDIARSLLERSIGRSPAVRTGFLTFLLERRDELLISGDKARKTVRHLAQQLHFIGGRAVLDVFDPPTVREALRREHDFYRGTATS